MSGLGYRHQKVQRLRRLLRKRSLRESEGRFVAEGAKVVAEALTSGAEVEAVFTAPHVTDPVLDAAFDAGLRVHELEEGVLERVTDTVTPQPVLAVVTRVDRPLSEVAATETLLVLVDVRDPGNAGTILRSAEAAGIGAVVFSGSSVDIYNPKTVRSSAGSLFHVPVAVAGDAASVLNELQTKGFVTIATAMEGGQAYDRADLTRRVALVFGNEANGLPDDLDDVALETVSIPIEGRSESLNVSMAASVLCFEVARQRRARGA